MHTRMDHENPYSAILKSQFHRNLRILRARIIRGKKMKQVAPGRLAFVHVQGVVSHVYEAKNDPVALTQKHARFLRMSALSEKRMHMHPHIQPYSIGSPQVNNSIAIDKFDSNIGGGEGGLHILQSCVREQNPELTSHPQLIRTQGHGLLETNTSCDAVVKQISPEVSKGIYVGVADDVSSEAEEINSDDENLNEIWKEMEFAVESCKEFYENEVSHEVEKLDEEDCDHSFILKDDIGYVCRVCGLVQKEIQHIFEFVYRKRTNTNSYYKNEPQSIKYDDHTDALPEWYKLLGVDKGVAEVVAHEKHIKQMKPHQMEGFNFLLRNLVTDNPHGCILAHAPGSGKTFMLICFLQSYLTKYPLARPLVILPKGILGTWKKEFQRWQLDDIPLYDFYTVKASNRSQQLNVLKEWAEKRSILFIGYQQFSSIVASDLSSKEKVSCREILLGAPTVLILDEGHTPRNKNTDILHSLTQVQTPRKVVLSGTLYQNHVQEVFNILNLVQPRFLKLERNHAIVRRIMSKVEISGVRKQLLGGAGDSAFYDLVENTLINDDNEQRKVGIIKDLREMTSHVLHYYKGDSFDELPGLVDFMVLLNLSPQQKAEVDEMKRLKEGKFKCTSLGSAIYVHPQLKKFSRSNSKNKQESGITSDDEMDQMIKTLNLKVGVKAMFFLNLLRLCDIAKEKLLVFSQYLLPLKFLERLAVHEKGWAVGKEIFMITGESTTEHRDWSMEQFNSSPKARVFFGSIKACGEGISLVGASRVLILDVHLNPSVSWQAICRAFRPGQQKKVFTYRLVAGDSLEEEDHSTCFKKEIIAKMWFEWDGHSKKDLTLNSIDVEDCGDDFLLKPSLRKDIKALYKR